MSALRLATPNHPTVLVDLGPASATGHVHDGGRLAVPEPEPRAVSDHRRAKLAEYQRRHRERRRVAVLACSDCGGDLAYDPTRYSYAHVLPGADHAPHVEGVRL